MAMSGILLLFLICNSICMDFTELQIIEFTEIDNLRSFIFTYIFIFMDNLPSVTDVSEIYMSYFFTSVPGAVFLIGRLSPKGHSFLSKIC